MHRYVVEFIVLSVLVVTLVTGLALFAAKAFLRNAPEQRFRALRAMHRFLPWYCGVVILFLFPVASHSSGRQCSSVRCLGMNCSTTTTAQRSALYSCWLACPYI
jgi:hypothetical protein